ncbi:MAG TPA: 50S ribosomal protein L22 [Candidatus Gracilibacteria bacterium]
MKAHLRRTRISPRKANVVAGLIRGKKASEALDILKFTPKKGAHMLHKALHSAVANAEHNGGKKRENLMIKEVIVNKGPSYKRHLPSTRGRALPIVKPTSHITITLEEQT